MSIGGFCSASSSCWSTSLRCPEGPWRASLPDSNLLLLLPELPLLHLLLRLQKTLHLLHLLHLPALQLLHTRRLQPAPTQISWRASWRPSWPSGRVRRTQPPSAKPPTSHPTYSRSQNNGSVARVPERSGPTAVPAGTTTAASPSWSTATPDLVRRASSPASRLSSKGASGPALAATSSQWPAEVTNPPDLWYSMDRPWVQEQFPQKNITCPPPITGNQPQPQQTTWTQPPSTSAAEVLDISYSQMLASDSSLLGQIRSNLTSPNQDRRTSSTSTSAKENPQDDDQTRPDQWIFS